MSDLIESIEILSIKLTTRPLRNEEICAISCDQKFKKNNPNFESVTSNKPIYEVIVSCVNGLLNPRILYYSLLISYHE